MTYLEKLKDYPAISRTQKNVLSFQGGANVNGALAARKVDNKPPLYPRQ